METTKKQSYRDNYVHKGKGDKFGMDKNSKQLDKKRQLRPMKSDTKDAEGNVLNYYRFL